MRITRKYRHLNFTTQFLFLIFSSLGEADTNQVARGRVIAASSLLAIGSSRVEVAELSFSVLTNQNGEFSLSLSEGTWVIFVTAPQYLDQSVAVEIGKKDITDLEILLYPAGQFSESIEVRGVVPRREEASASEVEPETVLRVAGGLDNIFRTIQTVFFRKLGIFVNELIFSSKNFMCMGLSRATYTYFFFG